MASKHLWARQALLPTGWAHDVHIEIAPSGRIGAVMADVPQGQADAHDVLLPAPANLHSHGFQRAMAGLAENRGPDPHDNFWTWRQLMYRFLERLTPEDIEAIAAFVQMQMLEAGYACNVEFHYLHHAPDGTPYATLAETSARIAQAAQISGIGLTLLPVLYQYGGCDRRELGAGQLRFGNDLDRFGRLLEGAEAALEPLTDDTRLGVAPHSLRAVSPESLVECISLRPDAPLHMHLAEQQAEVEEVAAAWGARPVQWLLDNAAVDARWCLIHCTQMQPDETSALAATGAVAGLCPITEASLGDGIFDGVRWQAGGGAYGIGSDSNIRINLTEELRMLEHSQRLRDASRAAMAQPDRSTGRVLLEAAAAGGAQAAGRASGCIQSGLWADLIALDCQDVDLIGKSGDTMLDAWIFAARDRPVHATWSAGRQLVANGQHIAHDRITPRYIETLDRIKDAV
ncbi:MAG: formimidoylglutamate deiminase [Spiribacter salinus]|uniref:Formimidoylglutamate deiminase n=1 Tax=Spiribacter salinus TaxID=1335746 RepID=A0A540VR69_9GAMM|nr:MAG: formimidoylglutamate deiminase [Spiribacter salinus]